jgi:hypothetical protein
MTTLNFRPPTSISVDVRCLSLHTSTSTATG